MKQEELEQKVIQAEKALLLRERALQCSICPDCGTNLVARWSVQGWFGPRLNTPSDNMFEKKCLDCGKIYILG